MCTLTTQKKSIKTTEDIQCFKIVNKRYENGEPAFLSGFQLYEHKINKIDKARITFDKRNESKFRCFDDMERTTYYAGFGLWESEIKPEYAGKLKAAVCGFHSSTIENRLLGVVLNCRGQLIVKCIIPKGSLVYHGSDGLIVSNKIIVTDKIVK